MVPEKWQARGCVSGAVRRRLSAEMAAGTVLVADFPAVTEAYARICDAPLTLFIFGVLPKHTR